MDIHSLIKSSGPILISLGSVLFTPNSFSDVNADTSSEDRFWIDRSHKNLAKIKNFQALVEQTISKKSSPLISKVIFQQPNNFYQVVIQPETFKDFETSYNNNTLTLHDGLNKQGLQIKGLEQYKKSSSLDRVKGIYMYNKENYEQTFTPSIHVAKRLSVGIDFIAKADNLEIKKVEAFIDYHHSLIMQSNLIFSNGIQSKIKNISMEFNSENLSVPKINLSNDSQIEAWDFNEKHLSKKNISRKIDQNIVWPEDENNTWGFSTHEFYKKKNKSQAAAYYYSDNFFLITLTKKSSSLLNQLGIPLALEETQTVFNQFLGFSTLEFKSKGIHYTLLSDIHPESLLSIAKDMLKPAE